VPRAKLRTPELRDHVLAVALEQLEREGIPAFTTRGLAAAAGTSTPAIYELFGDRGGLVRAVFFESWRRLSEQLATLRETDDPRADLLALGAAYRRFVVDHSALGLVMLSQPFTDFDPSREEARAGMAVRDRIVAIVRRCVDGGVLRGDPLDIAHALTAVVQGLAAAESGGRLGRSRNDVDRRWRVATEALLDGFGPWGREDPR
jgi:AcrR family transcriptional regulator